MSDSQIDAAAEKMRRWAKANSHRAVARKSDWDVTFRNWMDNDAEKAQRSASPNRPAGRGHGFAAARLMTMQNGRHDDDENA